jgi:hypothetical protein
LDQAFIFIVSVLIAFGLSWHVYSSWIYIAINTGVAAAVAALGVREVCGLQPNYQRHRWVLTWKQHSRVMLRIIPDSTMLSPVRTAA